MFKLLFIAGVAVALPVFFLLTWLVSSYHRLAGLREKCLSAQRELERQSKTESYFRAATQAYSEAVSNYNRARETFPASALASVFGFKAWRGKDP